MLLVCPSSRIQRQCRDACALLVFRPCKDHHPPLLVRDDHDLLLHFKQEAREVPRLYLKLPCIGATRICACWLQVCCRRPAADEPTGAGREPPQLSPQRSGRTGAAEWQPMEAADAAAVPVLQDPVRCRQPPQDLRHKHRCGTVHTSLSYPALAAVGMRNRRDFFRVTCSKADYLDSAFYSQHTLLKAHLYMSRC